MSTQDADPFPIHLDTMSRYDLVLATIPSAFLLALLAGGIFSVSPRSALAVGSIISALAVVDALFLNPPTGRSPGS